jgi:hypothetical protein
MTDEASPERPQTGRSLARRDFEQVIRRAAELSASEGDPDEQLSEDEIVRIGQELGLSSKHVQRALYELPELTEAPRWYDRYFGPGIFSVNRVVPSPADPTMNRLQDYLITREYLQIMRRRGQAVAFAPADDTLSTLARAFMRPGRRHLIARASRVIVNVQSLPENESHVRFDVDLGEERRQKVKAGFMLGALGGTVLGAVAAGVTAVNTVIFSPAPEIMAFTSTFALVTAASVSAAAARFKNRVLMAKFELAGLLDRVEHGESLEPPPAPWRRRLQLGLFGSR